jgi:ribosomal protein S6--L-glutamate ligase
VAGTTGPRGGSPDPTNPPPPPRPAPGAAARRMGLSFAGVDMLASAEGPMIMEVNSSPGLQGIERTANVDVAEAVILYLERNVRRGRNRDRVGR